MQIFKRNDITPFGLKFKTQCIMLVSINAGRVYWDIDTICRFG